MNKFPALVLVLALLAPAASRADELLDRIAAVVNGQVITLSEVQERAEPLFAQAEEGDAAARQTALRQALESVIEDKLLESALESRRIEISEAQIDQAIKEVVRQNSMTEEQFRQAIQMQGYTWEAYRGELASQLKRYQLLNAEVRSNITVTDEDVQGWLARNGRIQGGEEVRVRHILVRVPAEAEPATMEAARQKAQAALARVKGGEAFAEVAAEVSEDSTAEDGGDLGWFGRGTMVASFEKAAFGAEAGALIGPVRTRFGWHVLEVQARRKRSGEASAADLAEARRQVYDQELQRQTKRFVDALRRQAVIDIRIPELRS